jgi:Na+/alanine symporter
VFLICILSANRQVNKDYNSKNESELHNSVHRVRIYLLAFFVIITIFTIICIVLSIGQIQFSFLSSQKQKIIKYIIAHICILIISSGLYYYMNSILNNISIINKVNNTKNIFLIMPLFGTFQLIVLFVFSSNIAKHWLNVLHHYNNPHHFIQLDDITVIRPESDENPLEYTDNNNEDEH